MPKKATVIPKLPLDLTLQVQTVPLDCGCEGCQALELAYGTDLQMHLMLRRRLLQRGWAGTAPAEEKAYQRAHVDWAQRRPPEGYEFTRSDVSTEEGAA